ncbi:MAG TPA: hypothetical protein VF011_03195 [Terriglobales bacterium]
MLAKCANPVCNTPFRRLSEGKLFLVESESANGQHAIDPRRNKPPRRIEYFWLCSECAHVVTLAFHATAGVMTVPLPPSTQPAPTARPAGKPITAERTAGMLARAGAFHHD